MSITAWGAALNPITMIAKADDLIPFQVDQSRLSCLQAAAVLLPLIEDEVGIKLLLTRRADHLKSHAGQIAFPGGKVEEGDSSLQHTALRETFEEIGISEDFIEPLGFLPPCKTSSGFCVFPLLARVKDGYTLTRDPNEVAEIFEVPLSFLMSPENHHKTTLSWEGQNREVHRMPYHSPTGQFYDIWGVTAQIIMQLYDIDQKRG